MLAVTHEMDFAANVAVRVLFIGACVVQEAGPGKCCGIRGSRRARGHCCGVSYAGANRRR